MENIYDPTTFQCSEPINIKEYFDKYSQFDILTNNDILLGSNSNLEDLQKRCSVDRLTIPEESGTLPINIPEKLTTRTKLPTYPVTPEALKLNTIQWKTELEENREVYVDCKAKFFKTSIQDAKPEVEDMVPLKQFIITMIVYKPFSRLSGQLRTNSENMRFMCEIDVLNTNTLAEFVNYIQCISDWATFMEVESTQVNLNSLLGSAVKSPSRTIFIGDTFYNDLSNPKAIDYSANIRKWAKDIDLANFKTADMNTTTFEMLSPRFGYPYVYIHQGDCEHIIVFSNARLATQMDCLNSKQYPKLVHLRRDSFMLCFLCTSTDAKWLVIGSDRLPQEKVYLCTQCCNSYLYLDGKKIGQFSLYPYFDSEMLAREFAKRYEAV